MRVVTWRSEVIFYGASQSPLSEYARCSPPFEVAGEKRPINTGLSRVNIGQER